MTKKWETLTIQGHAKPKGSWNAVVVRGRIRYVPVSKVAGDCIKYIKEVIKVQWKMKELWTEPVEVDLLFKLPRAKSNKHPYPTTRGTGDIDKLTRAILDGMTEIVYKDDVQVCKTTEKKVWQEDGKEPEVQIKLRKILD